MSNYPESIFTVWQSLEGSCIKRLPPFSLSSFSLSKEREVLKREESTLHGIKSNQSDWLDFKQVITGVKRHRLEADPRDEGIKRNQIPTMALCGRIQNIALHSYPNYSLNPPYNATLFLIF